MLLVIRWVLRRNNNIVTGVVELQDKSFGDVFES